jgi:poly(ADP-ribose) glycohydrolase ARH3
VSHDDLKKRFEGSVLGLALGDAFGAPYEGGPIERLVWATIGKTQDGKRRWTDDTCMSLDLIDSLVAHRRVDQDDLIARFARSYRWRRGYGPGAAKLLKRVRRGGDWRRLSATVFPGGSFGNGGATRSPIVGLFYWDDVDGLMRSAHDASVVTHAHPLGIEGATIVAQTTAAALTGVEPKAWVAHAKRYARSPEYLDRFSTADTWLASDAAPTYRQVSSVLGNGIAATESCATAVYLAARFVNDDFRTMLRFVADVGGDTDTIGAMAGAIWGAARGADALPGEMLDRLEDMPRLRDAASALYLAWSERRR